MGDKIPMLVTPEAMRFAWAVSDGEYKVVVRAAILAESPELFGEAIAKLSPAARLALITELYAPMGFDKRGRRIRKGLIDRPTYFKLLQLP